MEQTSIPAPERAEPSGEQSQASAAELPTETVAEASAPAPRRRAPVRRTRPAASETAEAGPAAAPTRRRRPVQPNPTSEPLEAPEAAQEGGAPATFSAEANAANFDPASEPEPPPADAFLSQPAYTLLAEPGTVSLPIDDVAPGRVAEGEPAEEPPAAVEEPAAARGPARRRGQRGRRGRGTRTTATGNGEAEPPAESGDLATDDNAVLLEYEPLPPPTKRKAPRLYPGMRGQRASEPAENAVDWALGRTQAEPASSETGTAASPAPAAETEAGTATGRRRSRRGRRGRGNGNGVAAPPDEQEEREPRSSIIPEERFLDAQQRRPPSPAARDDRGRSQLSAFESLVARQNVVLDTLLARISSFTAIERALTAVEHRLSSQGFGATGTAAPRVGIFVDVPNIIYAAERIGVTIDFSKLLHRLTRGRELVRASAYAPISDDPQQRLAQQKFVQPFIHGGYRIVTKPLKRFADGTMKGNFDVELALDVLMMADRLDIVSLISGDGDFSRLVDLVGSKGVRVEVIAFGTSTSAELRAICDDYVDLSAILNEIT